MFFVQFYSASFTRDLSEVINHVSSRYPKSKLYAVGWSLGANILIRYLGQVGHTISFYIPVVSMKRLYNWFITIYFTTLW